MSIGTSRGEGNSPEKPNYITVKSILLMSALRQKDVTLIARMPGDVRHLGALLGVQSSPSNPPPIQGSDLRKRKRLRAVLWNVSASHINELEPRKLDQLDTYGRFLRLRART